MSAALSVSLMAVMAISCGSSSRRAAAPASAPASTTVRQIPVTVGSPPLKATLTVPAGSGPFPAVVLVSGSGPNDQDETDGADKPFLDLALGLAAKGIVTLRYDKRTHDYPTGLDPSSFTAVDEYVPDAVHAIDLLGHQSSVDHRRIFVLGHSQGGTFAPLIAQRAPQVAGVVLLAAATEPFGAALLRQTRYLATLGGSVGARYAAALPEVERLAPVLDSPALAQDPPSTVLLGGVGPAYYLSLQRYHEVATARAIPQPLLILQGDRDYEVTVADDLSGWTTGLAGRPGVTVARFPQADHLFIDGSGPASPLDENQPRPVDAGVTAAIVAWMTPIRGG
jgi:uncharacterized protein